MKYIYFMCDCMHIYNFGLNLRKYNINYIMNYIGKVLYKA